MPSNRRRRAVAVALPVALVAGGTGWAALSGAPSTEQVSAEFAFSHVVVKERDCTGADGSVFAQQVVIATGTSTGDPRLSGEVTFHSSLLVDTATGEGMDVSRWRVRDASGAWKAQGAVTEAGIDEISQGTLVGQVRTPAGPSGDRLRLIAGFRLTFHPNGAVTGRIGGDVGDGRLPAVLVGGSCAGPSERFEVDLPAPDDPVEPGLRATRRIGWRAG